MTILTFNFMSSVLGISAFTDLHFALAAGVAESSFGLMLLLNKASRFVALTICFFFLSTGVILGYHELIGHFPVLVLAIIVAIQPNVEGFSIPFLNRNNSDTDLKEAQPAQ